MDQSTAQLKPFFILARIREAVNSDLQDDVSAPTTTATYLFSLQDGMSESIETSLNQHSTLVSTAALIINALEFYGLDYQTIMEEAGFDAEKVYSPSERISTAKLKILWDLSTQYTGDPCFGLTYAAYIQPSA